MFSILLTFNTLKILTFAFLCKYFFKIINRTQVIKHYKESIKPYKETIKHYKESIKPYKETIKHYKESIISYKETIKHYKESIKHFKKCFVV
jgi:predicted RNase H-like nuclease (RuvC/YqgF family)